MRILRSLDHLQQQRPVTAVPVAVVVKATDDRAPHLAALLAYYGFVSLFPLLLLLSSILGFVLQGNPELRGEILNSALRAFPGLRGTLREQVTTLNGSGWALGIGIVGTLYGGLGIMQAAQAVMNRIYGVPRHRQPDPLRGRLRSAGMLGGLAVGVLGTAAATGALRYVQPVADRLGGAPRLLALLAVFVINVLVFAVAYQLLVATPLRLRDVVVGGISSAATWQLLHLVAGPLVAARIADAGAVYGVFALVLTALAWIYVQAMVFVISAELNIVLSHRLWPRTLPGAGGDGARTDADRRAHRMCHAQCRHPREGPSASSCAGSEARRMASR